MLRSLSPGCGESSRWLRNVFVGFCYTSASEVCSAASSGTSEREAAWRALAVGGTWKIRWDVLVVQVPVCVSWRCYLTGLASVSSVTVFCHFLKSWL